MRQFLLILLLAAYCFEAGGQFVISNDLPANATMIRPGQNSVAGTLFGATSGPPEPAALVQRHSKLVWYKWIAPSNGTYLLEHSSGVWLHAVRQGEEPNNEISQNDWICFHARQSEEVLLAVGGSSNQDYFFTFGIKSIPSVPMIAFPALLGGGRIGSSYSLPVQGRPPLHYRWFANGVLVSGETNSYFSRTIYRRGEPPITITGEISMVVSNEWGSINYTFVEGEESQDFPAPVNDLIENAILLKGTNVIGAGTTDGATRSISDPPGKEKTAWWSWIAPDNRFYEVSSPVEVYFREANSNLTSVSSRFRAEAGRQYFLLGSAYYGFSGPVDFLLRPSLPMPYISAVGSSTENGITTYVVTASGEGPFTYQWLLNAAPIWQATNSSFQVTQALSGSLAVVVSNQWGGVTTQITFVSGPPPPNDHYTNRIILAGGPQIVHVDLSGATAESFEGNSFLPGGSVWYEWIAPESGVFRFVGPSGIFVFSEGELVGGIQTPGGPPLTLFVEVQEGKSYQICARGYLPTSLTIAKSSARPIMLANGASARPQEDGSLDLMATASGAEPMTYTWKRNGEIIYQGYLPRVYFQNWSLTEGDYTVTVSNPFGSASSGLIHVRLGSRAENDDFANAEMVAVGQEFGVTNALATRQSGEPRISYGTNTLWYKWVALSNGFYEMQSTNYFQLFKGSSLADLIRIPSGGRYSPLSMRGFSTFEAVASAEYFLQILPSDSRVYGVIRATSPEPKIYHQKVYHSFGESLQLRMTVRGMPPMEGAQLLRNGVVTRQGLMWQDISADDAGIYTMRFWNNYGEVETEKFEIKVHDRPELKIYWGAPGDPLLLGNGNYRSSELEESIDLTDWMPIARGPADAPFVPQDRIGQRFYRLKGID